MMDDALQRDHHSLLQEEPRDPPQPDLANVVRVVENLLQAIKDCQRPQPPPLSQVKGGGAWVQSRLTGPTARSAFSTPVVSVTTSGHSEKV